MLASPPRREPIQPIRLACTPRPPWRVGNWARFPLSPDPVEPLPVWPPLARAVQVPAKRSGRRPIQIPDPSSAIEIGERRRRAGGKGGRPGRSTRRAWSARPRRSTRAASPRANLTGRGHLLENHPIPRVCGHPSNIGLPTWPDRPRENRRNPPFSPCPRISPRSTSSSTSPAAPIGRLVDRPGPKSPKVSPPLPRSTCLSGPRRAARAAGRISPVQNIAEISRSEASSAAGSKWNRVGTALEPLTS